jgi:tRNA 2-thiouridine synthesizing protein A
MSIPTRVDIRYDGGPAGCGELIMNLFRHVKSMQPGQVIELLSYDLGAREDIPAWCRLTGHELLASRDDGDIRHYYIQKKKES